jgi:hypothetical protein
LVGSLLHVLKAACISVDQEQMQNGGALGTWLVKVIVLKRVVLIQLTMAIGAVRFSDAPERIVVMGYDYELVDTVVCFFHSNCTAGGR